MLIERVSWDEARPLLTRDAIDVIALGAQSKEHGRHLPLNNDWLVVAGILREIEALRRLSVAQAVPP